jgi:hypothetical protein
MFSIRLADCATSSFQTIVLLCCCEGMYLEFHQQHWKSPRASRVQMRCLARQLNTTQRLLSSGGRILADAAHRAAGTQPLQHISADAMRRIAEMESASARVLASGVSDARVSMGQAAPTEDLSAMRALRGSCASSAPQPAQSFHWRDALERVATAASGHMLTDSFGCACCTSRTVAELTRRSHEYPGHLPASSAGDFTRI